MSSNIYSSGIANVGSYLVSGTPYLTGATVANATETIYEFPRVTKRIVVANVDTSHDLEVYFSASSTAPLKIPAGKKIDMDVKCAHIYMKGSGGDADMQMYAEITSIPTGSMYSLAGLSGV